jgi:hypothetical protein
MFGGWSARNSVCAVLRQEVPLRASPAPRRYSLIRLATNRGRPLQYEGGGWAKLIQVNSGLERRVSPLRLHFPPADRRFPRLSPPVDLLTKSVFEV